MRDYGKVASSFWTGRTGRLLRGDPDAQIVALYLMSSPHATMIGVFTCPIAYMAHETGSSFDGASKGLRRLSEVGFLSFDDSLDLVWVHEMARFQIGERLKAADKRVQNVAQQFRSIPTSLIKLGFFDRYRTDFHLPICPATETLRSPFEAPSQGLSKPLRSQEQEQEQEQEFFLARGATSQNREGHGGRTGWSEDEPFGPEVAA